MGEPATTSDGMSAWGRVALIVGISLGMVATIFAAAPLEEWLKHVLPALPYRTVLAQALKRTAMVLVWLLPVLVFPRLRAVGSFRLPVTWTVLLVVPDLILTLPALNWMRTGGTWPHYLCLMWTGMAAGVFEELLFCGYAFLKSPQTHPRLVICASAAGFTLVRLLNLSHQSLDAVLSSLPWAIALGLAFGVIRMVSGSLGWCMFLHGLINLSSRLAKEGNLYENLYPVLMPAIACAAFAALYLHPKLGGRAAGRNEITAGSRVTLIVGLSLGAIVMVIAAGWLKDWLEVAWSSVPDGKELGAALVKTGMAAIWLLPWLFLRRMRDIGSFHLPWTWTVLLGMPVMVLSVVFVDPQRLRFPLAVYVIWEAMATGVFEELVFRGYAFRHSPQTHPRTVVFTSAICFTLLHFLNATREPFFNVVYNMPGVFVLGLAFSIIRLVSGSLAWCMLLHGVTDVFAALKTDNETLQALYLVAIGLVGIPSLLVCFLHPKLRVRGWTAGTLECAAPAGSNTD